MLFARSTIHDFVCIATASPQLFVIVCDATFLLFHVLMQRRTNGITKFCTNLAQKLENSETTLVQAQITYFASASPAESGTLYKCMKRIPVNAT